jgi:hypothetical protein
MVVGALLLSGVVWSLIVAVACATVPRRGMPREATSAEVRRALDGVDVVLDPSSYTQPSLVFETAWRTQTTLTGRRADTGAPTTVIEERSGWPIRVLRGYRITDLSTGRRESTWLFAIPHRGGRGSQRALLVPVAPRFGALAASTVLYALVSAQLVGLHLALRRRMRLRTGRCPSCGYLLTGGSTACPECGALPREGAGVGRVAGSEASTPRSEGFGARVMEGQLGHVLLLTGLLAALLAATGVEGFTEGSWLGISTSVWVALAVGDAVLHQGYVWLCWRTELHGQVLTRLLGATAFTWYAVGFTALILARPVLVTAVAVSNAGTFPGTPWVMRTMAVLATLPGLYLLYSIRRYFGFMRAFGIDHFDPSYRSAPLVREGIFRFSRNAMYDFGFLLLWVPGLLTLSVAALCVALFSHLYIWVHYRCTERPDMVRIYGPVQS